MICTDFRGLASPIVIRYNPTCESTRGSVIANVIRLRQMQNQQETLVQLVQSIADTICENQMYHYPGFAPETDDPDKFFPQQNVDFDGCLFIRYPTKIFFNPISEEELQREEHSLGISIPADYRLLLHKFGEFHMPGDHFAGQFNRPSTAAALAKECFGFSNANTSALAIASYSEQTDGNAIGYLRNGERFSEILYKFDHETANPYGDTTSTPPEVIADSLTEFLKTYIADHQFERQSK